MTDHTHPGWVGSPWPTSPPPVFVPHPPPGPPAPASIVETLLESALHKYIYIWLLNGDDFWAYPTVRYSGQIEGYCWRDGLWGAVSVPYEEILHLYV